mmetsp:Transcript_31810/g.67775  ORF Transcript_31810/g.67775 Transcript_31810/m.67775 type:complete len:412 (+) Transcript_31810:226-1461(+)
MNWLAGVVTRVPAALGRKNLPRSLISMRSFAAFHEGLSLMGLIPRAVLADRPANCSSVISGTSAAAEGAGAAEGATTAEGDAEGAVAAGGAAAGGGTTEELEAEEDADVEAARGPRESGMPDAAAGAVAVAPEVREETEAPPQGEEPGPPSARKRLGLADETSPKIDGIEPPWKWDGRSDGSLDGSAAAAAAENAAENAVQSSGEKFAASPMVAVDGEKADRPECPWGTAWPPPIDERRGARPWEEAGSREEEKAGGARPKCDDARKGERRAPPRPTAADPGTSAGAANPPRRKGEWSASPPIPSPCPGTEGENWGIPMPRLARSSRVARTERPGTRARPRGGASAPTTLPCAPTAAAGPPHRGRRSLKADGGRVSPSCSVGSDGAPRERALEPTPRGWRSGGVRAPPSPS